MQYFVREICSDGLDSCSISAIALLASLYMYATANIITSVTNTTYCRGKYRRGREQLLQRVQSAPPRALLQRADRRLDGPVPQSLTASHGQHRRSTASRRSHAVHCIRVSPAPRGPVRAGGRYGSLLQLRPRLHEGACPQREARPGSIPLHS